MADDGPQDESTRSQVPEGMESVLEDIGKGDESRTVDDACTVASGECSCKFGRSLREYDIGDEESDFLSYYLGLSSPPDDWLKALGVDPEDHDSDALSVRKLEKLYNLRLIHAILRRKGILLPVEVLEEAYEIHQEGNEIDNGFPSDEIDLDQISDNYVTYSTISRHFSKCCDVSGELKQSPITAENAKKRIESQQSFHRQVIMKQLEKYAEWAEITLDNKSLEIEEEIYCEQCGDLIEIKDFIDGKSCSCDS